MNKPGTHCAIGQRIAAAILFALITFTAAIAPAADDNAMLYFFTSKGCAPCIQVKEVIKQLDSEGYPVTTIDVGERPDWADAFRVTRTPTLALVRNNEVLGWQPRPMRSEELRGWFRTIQYRLPTDNQTSTAKPAPQTPQKQLGSVEPAGLTRPPQTKVSLASHSTAVKNVNGSFSSPTMHQGTREPQNDLESTALNATVRLEVKDDVGTSFATGTVIHTHAGESLVLTCGHVFRESQGKGEITAEFGFANGSTVKVPGQILDYDSDAHDIALVSIRNGEHPLTAVEVAAVNSTTDRGDRVFSLGCDRGEDPTIRNSAIKNLARYDGSMKYDIYGRPVNGRSGGGLFNSKGQLIGVCNAAAVEVDEGIYTALETVHWQLAKTNLDHLFNGAPIEAVGGGTMIAANTPQTPSVARASNMVPIRRRSAPVASRPEPKPSPRIALASQVRNVSLEQAIPDSFDKEVVITVRSKSNPLDTRTITISDPTPKLLDYLDGMDGDESRSVKLAEYRQWR